MIIVALSESRLTGCVEDSFPVSSRLHILEVDDRIDIELDKPAS
jgi:hypothetical protein